MKIGITLRAFPQEMDWQDCLKQAARAGFDGVEINFDGRFPLDASPELLDELAAALADTGLEAASVYSRQQWWTPISSPDPARRQTGIDAVRRLIALARRLGAPRVLVIPGAVDNSILASSTEIVPYEQVWQRSLEALTGLAAEAEEAGVELALENVPGRFLLSPLEMGRFIEAIASPAVGLYMDTANCLFLGGYPEQWIRLLGRHLRAVHLKDYRLAAGGLSGFVDVFEGDTDWPAVCQALAETGYDGYLVSEVLPPFRWHPEELWLSSARRLDLLRQDILRLR